MHHIGKFSKSSKCLLTVSTPNLPNLITSLFSLWLFSSHQAGIPVSEELLNEVIDSLDTDGDDVVDYRELVAGVKDYKLMEREKGKTIGIGS